MQNPDEPPPVPQACEARSSPARDVRYPNVLTAILCVAAFLRLAGIGVGLPEVEYVDAFKFVGSAAAMARDGNFQPREFQNPALYADVLSIVYRALKIESPGMQSFAARIVSAFAGLALVLVVWRAARSALSPAGALLAAALAAVSIEFVTLSRYPLTDLLLTLFMTASLGAFISEDPRPRRSAVAGIFLGLAIATKWTGLYLILFLAIVAAIRVYRTRSFRAPLAALARAAILCVAIFFLFNPHFIEHFSDYRSRFLLEARLQQYGQIGRVQGGWLDYFISATPTWEMPWLGTSLSFNMWALLSTMALCGLFRAIYKRESSILFFHALYIVFYFLLIIRPGHIKAARFLAPILPSFYILAASIAAEYSNGISRTGRRIPFGLLAALLVAIPFLKSARLVWAARQPMTNRLARRWLETNLAYEPGVFATPFFLDDLEKLPRTPLFLSGVGPRQYRIPGDPNSNAELDPIYNPQMIDALRDQKIDWIVTNSWFDGAFSPVSENLRWFPKATASYAAWRQRLAAEGEIAWSVKAAEVNSIGPDIEIWHLKPPSPAK